MPVSAAAEIVALPAAALAEAVRSGELRALEATQAYLEQVAARDVRLRAYLHVAPAQALAQAAAVDAALARGEAPGPLAGVPFAVKDNLVSADMPTSAGSRILAGYRSPFECDALVRLRAAGAVLLGKLALDEFGMGATGEAGAGPAARNPWSLRHVPGGSSSGPAAAVAGRLAAFAVGSDTGGSIRVPAAHCGLVGVRPTWGRVSRRGLVAFASSLDAVGPLARDVDDAARVLGCLAGHDPGDSTSLAAPVPDYPAIAADARRRGLAGVRLGVPRGASEGADPEVARAFAEALRALVDAGAELVEVALPPADELLAAYAALSCAEAASNLARFDGLRHGLCVPRDSYEASAAATRGAGFGPEVKRRLIFGARVQGDPSLRGRAERARARARAAHAAALERCAALIGPTCAEPAPRAADAAGAGSDGGCDIWDMSMESCFRRHDARDMEDVAAPRADRFAVGASLAGLPALTLPAGWTRATPGRPALPIGLQIVGRALDEAGIFALAAVYEAQTPWRGRVAPEAGP